MSRLELFSFDEVAVVHVMNRVVRRCFLLGDDPLTRKSYDHRKTWIEDQLRLLASHFGIDLLGFAIPSNHFHLMLRSRPDCIEARDDAEFARRWLMRCPVRKDAQARAEDPNEMELNKRTTVPHLFSRFVVYFRRTPALTGPGSPGFPLLLLRVAF